MRTELMCRLSSLLMLVLVAGCGATGTSGDDFDGGGFDRVTIAGTWTDPESGLTWQDPPYTGSLNLAEAENYCDNLALEGMGWRLPTIQELRTLIRGCNLTKTGGPCNLSDDQCTTWDCQNDSCFPGCWENEGPANGCYWPDPLAGTCTYYWSSTGVDDADDHAYYVNFPDAHVIATVVTNEGSVRCVR